MAPKHQCRDYGSVASGPFLRAELSMKVKVSAGAMVVDGNTKVLITPATTKVSFSTKNRMFVLAHESGHDGIVRIFVGRC